MENQKTFTGIEKGELNQKTYLGMEKGRLENQKTFLWYGKRWLAELQNISYDRKR